MADQKYNIRLTATDETLATFQSMKRGLGEVTDAGETLKGVFAGLSAGVMVEFVKSGIESVNQLHELSVKANASVESLSAMRLSAAETSTSMDSVATAIAKLNKSIGEAKVAGGPKADLLETLGIDISAGRDAGLIMFDLAKKLSDMSDKQAATYVTSQLMSRGYTELAPFMEKLAKQGSLVAEVTTQQAEEANKLNDSIVTLTHHFALLAENQNVVNRLNDIFDAVEKTNTSSGKLAATWAGLTRLASALMGDATSEIGKSEEAVGKLMLRISQMQENIDHYNQSGAMAKFFSGKDYVKNMQADLDAANAALKAAIDKRDALYHQQNSDAAPGNNGDDASAAVLNAKKIAEAAAASQKIIDIATREDAATTASHEDAFFKWLDGWEKTEDKLTGLGAAGTKARAAHEAAYTVYVNAENIKRNDAAAAADAVKAAHLATELTKENDYFAKIGAMAKQYDKSAEGSEMQRFQDQIIEHQKRYEDAVKNHTLLLSEEEDFQTALGIIIATHQQQQLATGKANALAQLATAGTQFRAMFELNKVVRTAEAVVDGYAAVQAAYKFGASWGGPVGGAAMAAISLAATAANVMAIQQAQFGGGTGMNGAGGGGGGAPLTTPSPLAPVPAAAVQTSAPTVVNVYVTGNVLSNDYIQNNVIPAIQSAVNNSDVVIIDPRSRQAQVLAAV